MIVARHEVPGVMTKIAPSHRQSHSINKGWIIGLDPPQALGEQKAAKVTKADQILG